jgi:hypothetical protein
LVQAVRHWRPYLWGREFVVRTDHFSLKFLLDQRLSTIPQHQWASKLLGFDFRVEFKSGGTNVVIGTLSRRDAKEGTEAMALSGPSFKLFGDLRQEMEADPTLRALKAAVAADARDTKWRLVDGLVLIDGRVFINPTSASLPFILDNPHDAGHEGTQKTLHRLRTDFHLPGSRVVLQEYVCACAVCQRNKTEHLHPDGLLQPLDVPTSVWSDVAMDFIEGFPRINGKSVILTVVDRFSKYGHFIALGHQYTATSVARAFFNNITRLHGIPSSIVSDRNPVFMSSFWKELFTLSGTKLNMSSAFHPQTDDQSEAANKIITMYLRCLAGDRPRHWLQWLPWAEYCYNSSFQASIRTSPFKMVYGRDPPSIRTYIEGEARLLAVHQQLSARDEFLVEIHDWLEQAQQHYKLHYDRKHRDVEFQVDDWVWLRLLHRSIASLSVQGRSKLSPRFFRPF